MEGKFIVEPVPVPRHPHTHLFASEILANILLQSLCFLRTQRHCSCLTCPLFCQSQNSSSVYRTINMPFLPECFLPIPDKSPSIFCHYTRQTEKLAAQHRQQPQLSQRLWEYLIYPLNLPVSPWETSRELFKIPKTVPLLCLLTRSCY